MTPAPPSASSPRILSCLVCQQRKIKCDRTFPCGSCVKHNVACVPAAQNRPRKRRFPERQLLDRLRSYEDLLRRNNIDFRPLHDDEGPRGLPVVEDVGQMNTPSPTISTNLGSEPEAKSVPDTPHPIDKILIAYLQEDMIDHDDDDDDSGDLLDDHVRKRAVRDAWNALFDHDEYLLFGTGLDDDASAANRAALHPPLAQILRLWQVYLDNVNPLLKVTHAPSLQTRIIEAAADLSDLEPRLEALMFAIYCAATGSLGDDEGRTILGCPRKDALRRFQRGCQRALVRCRFLQTDDRDCLTAFFLYLCSMRPVTDPRSLSSMIGMAVRIARRMGLHKESTLGRCGVFEAEMRRRLWWAIVFFDTRVGQLAYSDTAILGPLWDCHVPLNVGDAELRPDMASVPVPHGRGTDAAFAVTRAELGDWVRNAPCHLDFTEPALRPVARKLPADGDPAELERRLEHDYLRHLDQGDPTHFMATWVARGQIAKCHIIQHWTDPAAARTDAERDTSLAHACRVLECDTRLLTSPLTKRFTWFLWMHFPFPAYLDIVEDLKRRPLGLMATRAWEVMNSNHEARFHNTEAPPDHPMMDMFGNLILGAWKTMQRAARETGQSMAVPELVARIERWKATDKSREEQTDGGEQTTTSLQATLPDDLSGSVPGMGLGECTGYDDFSWMGGPSISGDVMDHLPDYVQTDFSGGMTRWG